MLTLIRNAEIYTAYGLQRLDLLIAGGKVVRLEKEIDPATLDYSLDSVESESGIVVIEGEGKTVFPAFADMHVHFREPGYSYKETIRTGSDAARAGGYSLVCTMPNLNPAPDSLENLQKQLDIIRRDSEIEIMPYATITCKRMGAEFPDYEALAPYVAGFSDDGTGVQSARVMEEAMKRIAPTGKIVAAHCEVDSMLKGGYVHDGHYALEHCHRGISSQSEWREVMRDIEICARTGCRLHICHISTAESVELVALAKRRGLPVTCETGPHYLRFNDSDLQEDGRFKMNPPIRSKKDQEALRRGLADGTIDVVATDHAPHAENEKNRGLEKSAMGVVGLETAFAAVYTHMVASGDMTLKRMVDAFSIRARRILGIAGFESGGIAVGDPAALTMVDLDAEFKVNPEEFKSMGKSTPFAGEILKGKVEMTLLPCVPGCKREGFGKP